MLQECQHGAPDPTVCPPCNPFGRAFTRPPATEFGASFTAQFGGWCNTCDQAIQPGDAIRGALDGGRRDYRHTRCIDGGGR